MGRPVVVWKEPPSFQPRTEERRLKEGNKASRDLDSSSSKIGGNQRKICYFLDFDPQEKKSISPPNTLEGFMRVFYPFPPLLDKSPKEQLPPGDLLEEEKL